MAIICHRDQGRLSKASNIGIWKARLVSMLDEHGVKVYVEKNVGELPTYPRK